MVLNVQSYSNSITLAIQQRQQLNLSATLVTHATRQRQQLHSQQR